MRVWVLVVLLLLSVGSAEAQVRSATVQPVVGNGAVVAESVAVRCVDAANAAFESCAGAGGTSSNFGAAFPAAGTAAGFSDGTNMQGVRAFDADTGAGTQYVLGVNLRFSASGGSVEFGTATNPIRTDPTGTTTQPISATTLPLPTGASTAAKQPALGTAGVASADVITVQGIASMTAVKVDGSAVTQPVSGTVTTTPPANASTNVTQFGGTAVSTGTGAGGLGIPRVTISNDSSLAANQSVNAAQMNGVAVTMGNGISGTGVQRVTLASDSTGQVTLAAGANIIGALTANQSVNTAQMNGVAVTMNNGVAGTGVQRVTIASDSTGQIGLVPLTAGGTSLSRTVSAASTNATNVKASAGQVYSLQASNVNASARFVHLYNTAVAPTCNTSIIATYIVPGNTAGAGTNIPLFGAGFGTGIGFCITTANDGTGAVAASDVVLMLEYK